MADRYWVGGTGNWNASSTTNWSASSGGASGASVPTSSDNVIFDSASNATAYTVTITATANCADLTIGAPLAGAVTWAGSSALNIYGSLNLSGGTSGITRTYTGDIAFASTTTGKTVTLNSVTLSSAVTFSGATGEWTIQDEMNIGTSINKNFSHTGGTLNTNGQTITCYSFRNSGSVTRTLNLGASTINCTNSWLPFSIGTNLTFNEGTSTIKSNFSFFSQGLNYNAVELNVGAGVQGYFEVFLPGTETFSSLTFTSSGAGAIIDIYGDPIVTGLLTITGLNAGSGRLLMYSSDRGTQRTFTAGSVSLTNVDFWSIIGSGTSFTGSSLGDLGNNSGITFTSPVTRYWVGGTGNFGDTSEWSTSSGGASGASVPLPQDTAVFDSNSFSGAGMTVTVDCTSIPGLDFTNSTNSPTLTFNVSGSYVFVNGSLIYKTGMTSGVSSEQVTFVGSSSANFTSDGVTINHSFSCSKIGGTLTLIGNLTLINSSAGIIYLDAGTFDANDNDISCWSVTTNNFLNTTRVIFMGSGTWTLRTSSGGFWSVSTFGLTLNAETSTLKIANTGSGALTLTVSGGLIFYNIWFDRGASTGNITITGSNTFNEIRDTGTAAHNFRFTAGTTTTVTSFVVSGTVGKLITITSPTAANHSLIKIGSGEISCDYLSISRSQASPEYTWYAGLNSTNGGNNTGWRFTTPIVRRRIRKFF